MWSSFNAKAEKVETAVQRWASKPTFARLEVSVQTTTDLARFCDSIAEFNEPTASKLRNLERELAPIRRSMAVMERLIAKGSKSKARPDQTVSICYAVAMTLVDSTSQAFKTRDDSYNDVPLTTILSLIEPFAFLEPVMKLFSATPVEIWVDGTKGNVAAANQLIAGQLDHFLEMLHDCTDTITFAMLHPQMSHRANLGNLPVQALAEALWALTPITFWDLGLPPVTASNSVFNWSACMHRIIYMAQAGESRLFHIDLQPQRMVKMIGKVIEASVAAHAAGDQEERGYAHRCIEVRNISLASHVIPHLYGRNDYSGFGENTATTDDVRYLLRSVAALRAAAVAPNATRDFAVFSNRMAAVACSVAGICMEAAAYAENCGHPRDRIDVLCSSEFIECLQITAAAWTDMIRLSSAPTRFDFVKCDAGCLAMGIICMFLNDHVAAVFRNKQMTEHVWLSMLPNAAPRGLDACAQAARGASAVAAIAATIPTALSIIRSGSSEIITLRDKRSAPSVILSMGLTLQYAGLGFGNVAFAAAAAAGAGVVAPASLINELSLAAHACLHAALALQASGMKLKAESKRNYDSFDEAACRWIVAAMFFNDTLMSLSENKDAPLQVTLHVLAAAATLPQNRMENGPPMGASLGMRNMAADLRPVLVPDDVAGLEAIVRHGGLSTEAIARLQGMIQDARRTDGLGERQRRRLELLGRLPEGICANLRCSEPVPVGGPLKRCTGCRIAHYCGSLCLRCDWKHGHKAPCQAVQREREG